MKKDEIEAIVEAAVVKTVRELRKNGLLKRSDDVAYNEIGARLYEYYRIPDNDPEMAAALAAIQSDPYADVLKWFYRDHKSIDETADRVPCDRVTALRNKKRLCLRLYQILQ